jgi:hypothetical protein
MLESFHITMEDNLILGVFGVLIVTSAAREVGT